MRKNKSTEFIPLDVFGLRELLEALPVHQIPAWKLETDPLYQFPVVREVTEGREEGTCD